MYDEIFELLLETLEPLARVRQDPKFHPEGDALFHSLQTFDLAQADKEPPHVVAAALFHDIGKGSTEGRHEEVGAAFLGVIADERTCSLVGRHMDLMRDAPGTRRSMQSDPLLLDELERLREYDNRARQPSAVVTSCERALGWLLEPGIAEQWLHSSHHMEG